MTVGAFIATGAYCATAIATVWHLARRIVLTLVARVPPEHRAPRPEMPPARTVRR